MNPSAQEADRPRYLREVSALLWPEPASVVLAGGRGRPRRTGADRAAGGEFIVVPNARRPRLLVPGSAHRAAASAVRRYAEPGSPGHRMILRLLSTTMAVGAGGIVMPDRLRVQHAGETIETYLRAALDQQLLISLHIGPARANRKPVLQLLTPAGETVGFAKIGVTDLTRSLVRAERDVLHELARRTPGQITVPRVRHHGRWNGLEVLVQSPLPVWRQRTVTTPERLAAAMREIAHVGGVYERTLRTSPYWQTLGDRLVRLTDGDAARAVRAAYRRIDGGASLRFGAWHGDWTPWNMATLHGTILVWDWERFTHGVPLGFDAVHHALQAVVTREKRDPYSAVAGTVERAGEILAPFGVTGDAARLTAVLYLIDIAARYLSDGQAEAGARLGVLEHWLLPVLVDQAAKVAKVPR